MESRITVLGATPITNFYASKTGGAPREVKSWELKCMLHMEDGTIDVGTMRVGENLAPEGVSPGEYMIAYRAGRSFKEDKIVGIPCLLRPIGRGAVPGVASAVPAQTETKPK